MAMTCNGTYPANHPLAIALAALVQAVKAEQDVTLDWVRTVAEEVGVAFGSVTFDEAAALVGLLYSPTWDVYVSPQTWADVELSGSHVRRDPTVMAIALWHLGRGRLPN